MKGDNGRKKTWFKLGHERLSATVINVYKIFPR